MNLPKVVIFGGYGVFGSLIAEDLIKYSQCQVVIAGRDRSKAEVSCKRLGERAMPLVCDLQDGAAVLQALQGAAVVIVAAGPFQGMPLTALEAAMRLGVDYMDLTDNRDYLCRVWECQSRDTWAGDPMQPLSYNAWLYGYANPIRFTHPSGNMSTDPGDHIMPLAIFKLGLPYSGSWKPDGTHNGEEDGSNRATYYPPEWEQGEQFSINDALEDVGGLYGGFAGENMKWQFSPDVDRRTEERSLQICSWVGSITDGKSTRILSLLKQPRCVRTT